MASTVSEIAFHQFVPGHGNLLARRIANPLLAAPRSGVRMLSNSCDKCALGLIRWNMPWKRALSLLASASHAFHRAGFLRTFFAEFAVVCLESRLLALISSLFSSSLRWLVSWQCFGWARDWWRFIFYARSCRSPLQCEPDKWMGGGVVGGFGDYFGRGLH